MEKYAGFVDAVQRHVTDETPVTIVCGWTSSGDRHIICCRGRALEATEIPTANVRYLQVTFSAKGLETFEMDMNDNAVVRWKPTFKSTVTFFGFGLTTSHDQYVTSITSVVLEDNGAIRAIREDISRGVISASLYILDVV